MHCKPLIPLLHEELSNNSNNNYKINGYIEYEQFGKEIEMAVIEIMLIDYVNHVNRNYHERGLTSLFKGVQIQKNLAL